MDKKKYKFIEYVRYIDFIKQQLENKCWITNEEYIVKTENGNIKIIFCKNIVIPFSTAREVEMMFDEVELNKETRKIFPNLEFSIEIPKPCAGTATKWQRSGIIYKKGV